MLGQAPSVLGRRGAYDAQLAQRAEMLACLVRPTVHAHYRTMRTIACKRMDKQNSSVTLSRLAATEPGNEGVSPDFLSTELDAFWEVFGSEDPGLLVARDHSAAHAAATLRADWVRGARTALHTTRGHPAVPPGRARASSRRSARGC